MRYFVATGSSLEGAHPNVGIMTNPRTGILKGVREGRAWAADCDALSKHGFDEEAYYAHLDRMQPFAGTCAFAVVPDVPGDGAATLAVYDHAAPIVAASGFPLAYVLQDGCEHEDFPPCDLVFLGGTDPFRMRWGAELLARAHHQGLPGHVGRVNSQRRVTNLRFTHAGSCDGTFVARRGVEEGLQLVGRWLNAYHAGSLFSADDFGEAV